MFRFLNSTGIEYVLVGGIPAAIHGEPRVTADVDLVAFLSPGEIERILARARRAGARVRAREVRLGAGAGGFFRIRVGDIDVDFLVAGSVYEFELLTRRRWKVIFGVRVPIASPEDSILMKLVSGRPVDWADAKAIQIRRGSRLDRTYLERWARLLPVQRDRGKAIHRWHRLLRSEYRK